MPVGDDYMVSNTGKVRSHKRYKEGKLLKQAVKRNGYAQVVLYTSRGLRHCLVHRLIYNAFSEEGLIEGLTIDHANGDKVDNRIGNLRQISQKLNNRLSYVNGQNTNYGSSHCKSKLSSADVDTIKDLLEQKVPNVEIAKQFEVSACTISDIKYGRSRKRETNEKN